MKKTSDKYTQILKDARSKNFPSASESMEWYLNRIKNAKLKTYEPTKSDSRELFDNLLLFNYFPKDVKNGSFHEAHPLVIPFSPNKGGFSGVNFHHLPHQHRAAVFDALTGRQKLYGSTLNKLLQPSMRQYSYNNISNLQIVPEEQWHMALFLPTEKFQNIPKPKK